MDDVSCVLLQECKTAYSIEGLLQALECRLLHGLSNVQAKAPWGELGLLVFLLGAGPPPFVSFSVFLRFCDDGH